MPNADCILKTRQIIKDTFSNYVIAKKDGAKSNNYPPQT